MSSYVKNSMQFQVHSKLAWLPWFNQSRSETVEDTVYTWFSAGWLWFQWRWCEFN